MRYKEFAQKISVPIFTSEQARRVMAVDHANISLARWVEQGELLRLKRGLYLQSQANIDEQIIANYLYPTSYVSLENVLNQAGIMPDVSNTITSVVTARPRTFKTERGIFAYSRIAHKLFGGFELVYDNKSHMLMRIASPEKALLDYMYIRGVNNLSDSRIEWSRLNKEKLAKYAQMYPETIQREVKTYVKSK